MRKNRILLEPPEVKALNGRTLFGASQAALVTKRLISIITCAEICLTTGCARFGCKESVESQAKAPDGILVATSVVRDCGATTDFGTSVNLHRTDHGFDDAAGDIFVAMGRHHLNLKWMDADHLTIQCEDCNRKQVSKAVTILGKTEIRFYMASIPEVSRER